MLTALGLFWKKQNFRSITLVLALVGVGSAGGGREKRRK